MRRPRNPSPEGRAREGRACIATAAAHAHPEQTAQFTDPAQPAMPASSMTLDLERTALVVIDPQIDFMSPKGLRGPPWAKP
jgi:hypothetical protein